MQENSVVGLAEKNKQREFFWCHVHFEIGAYLDCCDVRMFAQTTYLTRSRIAFPAHPFVVSIYPFQKSSRKDAFQRHRPATGKLSQQVSAAPAAAYFEVDSEISQ